MLSSDICVVKCNLCRQADDSYINGGYRKSDNSNEIDMMSCGCNVLKWVLKVMMNAAKTNTEKKNLTIDEELINSEYFKQVETKDDTQRYC